jgi:hypothetical protein
MELWRKGFMCLLQTLLVNQAPSFYNSQCCKKCETLSPVSFSISQALQKKLESFADFI